MTGIKPIHEHQVLEVLPPCGGSLSIGVAIATYQPYTTQ